MTTKIERTAYHEAGHAVACYHLRIPFSSVTIIPKEKSLGHVKLSQNVYNNFNLEWDNSLRTVDRAERIIITFLAGQVADKKIANMHISKRGGDGKEWFQATELARHFVGNDEVFTPYINYLWARAKTLFDPLWLWAAVEAVAKELLIRKKMGNRLTRNIIREAICSWSGKTYIRP